LARAALPFHARLAGMANTRTEPIFTLPVY